ncbi:hypothetical protein NLU13_0960 [Sarocladium strictum]|uniref:CN hydrolase domain-containing protein n=1 Tax=Sarocladium strictum TaxID=5046 RepID=A0AA39LC04_SARSR|nr:hypothetical protein NLU13_0960 [Sarocladium strictum]
MASSSFKVALVQTWPKPLAPEDNFKYAEEQIRKAASEGIALAPSFALTTAQAQGYLQRYQRLAAELHVNICAGTIVLHAWDPIDGKQPPYINTSYFIDHHGQVLGEYTKTNLWIPERQHLTSNIDHARQTQTENATFSPHQVIETPLGRVGILVCWDTAFPEAFRQLVLAGAKIIIIPSFWTLRDMSEEGLQHNAECERLFVQSTLVTRAFESTAALIFCNAGGPAEEGFFGCSQVALPIVGKVPGSFDDGSEGTRVVDVDMKLVDIAERNYRIRQDLGREDWHYGYTKVKKAAAESASSAVVKRDTTIAQL